MLLRLLVLLLRSMGELGGRPPRLAVQRLALLLQRLLRRSLRGERVAVGIYLRRG